MVSLFSVILWFCSKCVFDFAVPLCEFPVFRISKEPSEDRRLAAGPGLPEWEVFRAGSSLLGLQASKTLQTTHGLFPARRPLDLGELASL